MAGKRKNWTRDELVVAFNLYCRTPFGRMHKSNPDIMQVAQKIDRTPSAVAMKMVNFASLDPVHKKRSVNGLKHGGKQDNIIWDEFHNNWESLAFESEKALERLVGGFPEEHSQKVSTVDLGRPTEGERITRVRLVQRFFRNTVLSSYNFSCTVCKLNLPRMLNASHIIPWAIDRARRADPRNGLSLCAFHDRAYDRGLMTIDEKYKIVLSEDVRIKDVCPLHRVGLLEIEGQEINMPERFAPDKVALAYHREEIFLK